MPLGAALRLLRLVGAECNIHAFADFLKLGNLGAGFFQRVVFRFSLCFEGGIFFLQRGDRQLELWEQIRRFAMKTANRWLTALPLRYDVEFDDLMSAAYIAMCEAASTYKAERGAFTAITLKQLTRHCMASERRKRQMTRRRSCAVGKINRAPALTLLTAGAIIDTERALRHAVSS